MAENKSQAQHLASLDFDISQLIETLKQVDEQTKAYGLQAGKNFYGEFQRGVNETKSSSATTTPKIIDDKSIESATQQISQLNSEYGKLAKTVENYNASGKFVGGKNTFIDSSGIETVVKYNEKLETVGQTMTANYAKAEKAAQAQLQKEQALRDNFHKKNMTQIDAEIAERERQSKIFSAQIKEQMTLRVKEQNEAKNVVSQIERMIEKQKQFNTLVSQQRTSYTNKDILNKSNQYISGLEQLKNQISSTGKVTEEQRTQITQYGDSIKQLSGRYQEAGTKGESFLQKISDKAKWLGAFYAVNELRVGFIQAITTIKETEDAVVSLQRVLNDDTISQSRMTDELYDIAVQYGRTFDEVSEVAQQFVQAGYNWTDAVETTRGTMLALNTAELDVTQSTEGLIAIMAQWGLKAEDYADVIDKINITADNFSVTSEKIVSALQRSSSSAKNANISLEETIGIITALAEATGRSGENIGTALNSLIIYTSKASALETFAENGSQAMKDVVAEYQRGAASIYDVWVQLSSELKNLTASQQEALFNSKEYQEFANQLESQAEEFTTQVSEIYGAAGTYRQNYFIALLNDMETVQEAVRGMSNAEGYSLTENEKYMESLSANWNQLKAVLAQLAVQLGETGLLDFLKSLTQIGIAIATVTKNLGGLLPVLTAVGGVWVSLKADKISKNVIEIGDGLKSIPSRLKAIVTGTTAVTTSTNAATAAENAAAAGAAAWQAAFGWIGIVASAISGLVMIFSGFKSANEYAKQAAIESANANLEEAKSLQDLKSEYSEIINFTGDVSEKTEMLAEFKKKLIAQYGLEKEAVEQLNGARQEELNFLDEEYNKDVTRAWVDIKNQYEDAVNSMEKASKSLVISGEPLSIDETTLNTLKEYLNVIESVDEYGNVYARSFEFPTQNLQEQRDILAEIIANGKVNDDVLHWAQVRYDDINKKIQEISESYSFGNEVATEFFFTQEETLKIIEEINGATSESKQKELYDSLIESVNESNYGLEAQKQIISEIEEMFPQFSDEVSEIGETVSNSLSTANEDIESLKESISELSSQIDDFQSAYDTVNSAIEEYNNNGYISVDTLQQLISMGAQYWDMLNITADGISLNENAIGNLINTQQQNIEKMIQQEAAAEILRIAQSYLGQEVDNTNDSMQNSTGATSTLAQGLFNVTQQAIAGSLSMAQFDDEVNKLIGNQVSGSSLNQMYQEMNNVIKNAQSLSSALSGISSGTQAWNKAANSASGASKNASDAQKKRLEEQKQAIKDRYDAEIEALKKVEKENDRIRKKEEYYRNREEALKDISKAETRSGIEYREEEEDARQKLEELDREWKETVEDWSIDDKIEELEALRDAEVAALDAQIDALSKASSGVSGGMVSGSLSASKDMLSNYETEFLEEASKKTEETYKEMFGETPYILLESNNFMLDLVERNSKEMYQKYQVNFFRPMADSFSKLGVLMPSYWSPFSSFSIQQTSPVVNNNKNANIFANVYNQNSMNSIISDIWKKP